MKETKDEEEGNYGLDLEVRRRRMGGEGVCVLRV